MEMSRYVKALRCVEDTGAMRELVLLHVLRC